LFIHAGRFPFDSQNLSIFFRSKVGKKTKFNHYPVFKLDKMKDQERGHALLINNEEEFSLAVTEWIVSGTLSNDEYCTKKEDSTRYA